MLLSALFADVDFGLSFLLGRNLHHHFTHSLGFAALYFLTCRLLVRRPLALWMGAAYTSHIALDLLALDTSPPFGMPILWPLSERYFISPVLVFSDIWRGSLWTLFGAHNWMAVGREVLTLAPLVALAWWLRRDKSKSPYRSSVRDNPHRPSS